MLGFLVRKFVPGWDDPEAGGVRARCAQLAGAMGIALNLLLFALKLPIGLFTGSIAITSDAFNNLSDLGSSLITLIGARMSERRPDREHPFGHGRIEYLSALGVAMLILLVGLELLKESFKKLISPEPVEITLLMAALLGVSILVKLWMFHYNRTLGKKIHSGVLRASATDSLNDVYITAVVLVSALLAPLVSLPIDAIAGLMISTLVLLSGVRVARETVDSLLGGRPDPELVQKIARMVQETQGIVGIHDMILHDYGPGRVMASVHAEVPDDTDINLSHERIDDAEKRIQRELDVPIVIHMDPISVNDERTCAVSARLRGALAELDPALSMHDFRMVEGENQINLVFDLVVPADLSAAAAEALIAQLSARMKRIEERYECVVQIDRDFAK